jgi:outer membrane protein OmpA-like peptidoglycan-associated protein
MIMSESCIRAAGRLASSLLVGGFVWSAAGLPAAAQDVSADQILKALAPAPVTRSLTGPAQPAMSPADHNFVQSLRGRTRSLSLDESDHAADIAKNEDLPKIDLDINFDFDSAAITPKVVPQLTQLGQALRDPKMQNSVVILGGYTDAKGSDEYNQRLSQRRAEAVKKYLVQQLNIPSDGLSTAGYGKRDLKNPADPFGAENRRVQVVNMGTADTASNH